MKKSGFTLIELLVVIAIITILASLVLPNLLSTSDESRRLTTEAFITELKHPLNEYASRHPLGKFPEASEEEEGNGTSNLATVIMSEGLMQLSTSNLTKKSPYQLVDAWGNPLRYHPWKGVDKKDYAHNKNSYDLWSSGPNGLWVDPPDDQDNVTNWLVLLDDGS